MFEKHQQNKTGFHTKRSQLIFFFQMEDNCNAAGSEKSCLRLAMKTALAYITVEGEGKVQGCSYEAEIVLQLPQR